tara:strand:+ start:79285 stop:79455 length:171 start_codon:yes stop_codon:yes gene_type:complete
MIAIGLAVLGALMGVVTARKRGGNRKDIAQYAAGFGIAFLVVGMIVTVLLDRALTL